PPAGGVLAALAARHMPLAWRHVLCSILSPTRKGIGMDNARHTPRPLQIAAAAALGALLMYLLDPQQGRRRIALARNQATRLMRHGRETADAGLRDLGHRINGLVAQL